MTVYDNRLFIGTYDASILQGPSTEPEYGADPWRIDLRFARGQRELFPGSATSATTASARCALDDGSGVVAGMANPANLAPGGGWELRLLKEGSP